MIVKFLKQRLRQHRLRQAGVGEEAASQPIVIGGWSLWPELVRRGSVVYSFGVGDSVVWDLEMIRRFGVRVHAFDPTPASIAWVQKQRLPREFVFHDVGIADFDGVMEFFPPRRSGNTHFSQERRSRFDRRPPVPGRVQRLSSIMRSLGHERIDVLKLDVEGAEFEAIPDLIASGIEVDQLLIEIHYQFRTRSFRMGLELIQQLKDYGMQCLYVSERGFEFSFVRRGLVDSTPVIERRARAA